MTLPTPEEEPTVELWPTAGRALGIGRCLTYELAGRNEFPGLIRMGSKYRVSTAALRKYLGMDVAA